VGGAYAIWMARAPPPGGEMSPFTMIFEATQCPFHGGGACVSNKDAVELR